MLALTDARTDAIDALHAATATYTSAHVVRDLLDRIDWPVAPGILADPSCGDGAFLVEAVRRLAPAPGDNRGLARVRGWELHPGACASARAAVRETLAALGWDTAEADHGARRMVAATDFLAAPPPAGSIAFLVGNPPFLRRISIPALLRAEYDVAVAHHAKGDMLHSFLDACDAAMSDDGASALITADRWLFSATTASLRAKLGERNGLVHLARLDARTSFHKPKFRQAGTPPRVHPVALVMRRLGEGMLCLGRRPTYPPEAGDDADAHHTTIATVPLSAIATVRLAPWLGPRGIFHLDADSARAAGIPATELVRVADTTDLPPDQDELRSGKTVAIRTHRDIEPPTAVTAHLRRTIGAMPPRGRQRTWWLPPEPLPPTPAEPGILVPRIANRLRAVPLAAGLLPISHNFHVMSALPGLDVDRLVAILRHPDVQRHVAATAPRLENGYFDIRAGYLRSVRVPVALLPDTARPNHTIGMPTDAIAA